MNYLFTFTLFLGKIQYKYNSWYCVPLASAASIREGVVGGTVGSPARKKHDPKKQNLLKSVFFIRE